MKTITDFFYKYKVFFSGLIGAIVIAIINIDTTNGLEWSDLVMPAVVAVSAYLANNLRGQLQSIIGIVFTIAIAGLKAHYAGGGFSFTPQTLQWVLGQVAILYFGYNAPPFKPRSYEHDPLIENAKDGGNTNVQSFYQNARK